MHKSESIQKIGALQRELARTMRGLSFRHWMQLNLSTTQMKSLFCIVENEHISSKQLAGALDVTPAYVTGIVDKLIEQGLVRRVENAEDRRVVFLEATDKGRRLLENLEQMATEHTSRILSAMTEDDLEHLYIGMRAFLDALKTRVVEQ